MTILLTEINVRDAYQKYYQHIDQKVFEEIVTAAQPNEGTILLPNTKWVLGLYKKKPQETIRDLSLLNNCFQMFDRLKVLGVLTGRSADLNTYSSIRDLKDVTDRFNLEDLEGDNTERKKRLMRPEFIEARNDIDILYEDDDWLVVSPKSYEASVYWGHGTSWCTAYKDQRSYYDSYSRQGRLYINIDKENGDKYQFHFESDSFMDKFDRKIENPIFDNMDATPNLVDFYEEELTSTNFEKLSEATKYYEFVERIDDRYYIASKTENTEWEYCDWEQKYNIIDSYNENVKSMYGFDDYSINRSAKCVHLFSDDDENIFDYQRGYVIFDDWVSEIVFNSDNRKITGIKNDDFIYFYDKDSSYAGYDEYKIADVISNRHLYLVNEDKNESEYCNIFDLKTGEFLFDQFYDSYESNYYKGSLKPILMLWDETHGIRKYNLETSELSDINLDIEYKDVRFLNDYQFAVQFDSERGNEKWMIYDVDSLQPRFNGAEFDNIICNYDTSNIPLVCYKGKWNIINFFKGKFAFPDLWFDDIHPVSQNINGKIYFMALIGDNTNFKRYLITNSGGIYEFEKKRSMFSSPEELSRTNPEHITSENKLKLTINDISYIINEAKRLISEISVKDAYSHYQDDIPEELYNWLVQTIQGDNTTLLSDTKWVLKCYRNEGDSMLPKLGDLVEALRVFDRMRIRGMLPPGITLEQCSSIDELIAFTNSVNHDEVFARTQKELDRDIKAAKNDIDVVFENDDWFVLIPKSMEASIYWGSKTKWCTATKTIENNRFEQYSENGPLYININKQTGAKYQFSFADSEWNDASNEVIPFPIIDNIEGGETLAPFYQQLCTGHLEWAKKPMFEIDCQFTGGGWTYCDELDVNCREVIKDGKVNIITEGFRLLSDIWFDSIDEDYPNYGFSVVNIGDSYYHFDYTKGLNKDSFAYFGGFLPMGKHFFYATRLDMISIVAKNDEKFNLMNGNGKLLLNRWFNEINDDYENRCFIGKLNGEMFKIDNEGKVFKL